MSDDAHRQLEKVIDRLAAAVQKKDNELILRTMQELCGIDFAIWEQVPRRSSGRYTDEVFEAKRDNWGVYICHSEGPEDHGYGWFVSHKICLRDRQGLNLGGEFIIGSSVLNDGSIEVIGGFGTGKRDPKIAHLIWEFCYKIRAYALAAK